MLEAAFEFVADGGGLDVPAAGERDAGVVELGGGRRVAADVIDHRVGLSGLLGKGVQVARAQPLCLIHAANEDSFHRAAKIVKDAYVIGERPGETETVLARITG